MVSADKGGTKGWADIHAHILPDVDDGTSDWEETGGTLCRAYKQGITHIIATPRYVSRQNTKRLKEMMKGLKEATFSISENVMVSLGQKVQYFEELPSFLEQGKVLTLAGSRHVLMELLPGDGYMRLLRAAHRLVQSSYLPVIAHMGQCGCLKEKGRIKELTRCGAYLQMNTGSLGGGLFDRQAAWCRKETLKGSIHLITTDMHGVAIRPLELEETIRRMTRQDRDERDAGEMAKRPLRQNRERILRDSVL